MNAETPPLWYHVTPLFLLPAIFKSGGIQCGADLQVNGLPQRKSSRDQDGTTVKELGNRRPSDCVMLFTHRLPPLLKDKLSKTRNSKAVWKAFPHAALCFCSAACLKATNYRLFGSPVNVGRALKNGETPEIRPYRSYLQVGSARVQELLIPADYLESRRLPISTLRSVTCFSPADGELVESHLYWSGHTITVAVEEQSKYVEGQSQSPGAEFLKWTKELYAALQSGQEKRQKELLGTLAVSCFD